MTAFLRLERGGTDLVIVPIEQREENVVIGPARQWRAALEDGGTEER